MSLFRRHVCTLLVGLLTLNMVDAVASDQYASNFEGMRLVDQNGRPFSLDRLAGQVLLVNFVYTGCSSVCPTQTRALTGVMADLPANVRSKTHFVSVSLDPTSDTPATLKSYAQLMGVDLKHWSFVTGTPSDIKRLTERLRLFRPGKESRQLADHSTSLWLINTRGELMQRLHGNPPDGLRLRDEIMALNRLSQ